MTGHMASREPWTHPGRILWAVQVFWNLSYLQTKSVEFFVFVFFKQLDHICVCVCVFLNITVTGVKKWVGGGQHWKRGPGGR